MASHDYNLMQLVCGAGVEPKDVDVAKAILTAILEGQVEGLADTEDMEFDGLDDNLGSNRGRCASCGDKFAQIQLLPSHPSCALSGTLLQDLIEEKSHCTSLLACTLL